MNFASSGSGGAPIVHVPYRAAGRRWAISSVAGCNRLLPDVPTFGEPGHPQVNVSRWYGLLALAARDVTERLRARGAEPMRGTPGDFRRLHARRDGEMGAGGQAGRRQSRDRW